MPTRPARNVPGSERYRDERRADDKPKMHGQQWHDHDAPKPMQPERVAGLDADTDVESGGDRAGMGRLRGGGKNPGTSAGRVRRKRTTPPSKGVPAKAKSAQGSRAGMKATKRAGNPG